MTKLIDWILEEAKGEPILAIVFGEIAKYRRKSCPHIPSSYPEKKILTWEEAIPWIQYEFSDGYGSEDCFPLFAWTENKVIAISCYDGSTSPFSIPRNPCDCNPFMPGG
jgi:hypothetical protein